LVVSLFSDISPEEPLTKKHFVRDIFDTKYHLGGIVYLKTCFRTFLRSVAVFLLTYSNVLLKVNFVIIVLLGSLLFVLLGCFLFVQLLLLFVCCKACALCVYSNTRNGQWPSILELKNINQSTCVKVFDHTVATPNSDTVAVTSRLSCVPATTDDHYHSLWNKPRSCASL